MMNHIEYRRLRMTPLEVEAEVPEKLISKLQKFSKSGECGKYLYAMDSFELTQIYQILETERINRKSKEMISNAKFFGNNWHNVMLLNLLISIGDLQNKSVYQELGTYLDFQMLERESDSLMNLESILLYCSGLLSTLPKYDFTDSIRENALHLKRKYELESIPLSLWRNTRTYANKNPILRLSQLANLFYNRKMLFNRIINCSSREDVFDIFAPAKASPHWNKYVDRANNNRVGAIKIDNVGINLVVNIKYAYGMHFSDDDMIVSALDLLERLPAESNGIISSFRDMGLAPKNAYETQALIELSKVYCRAKRCSQCPVAIHMCSPCSILDKLPDFLK